jgi:hypothetical protein
MVLAGLLTREISAIAKATAQRPKDILMNCCSVIRPQTVGQYY